MAELIEGWAILKGVDAWLFGADLENQTSLDVDSDEPVGQDVAVGFSFDGDALVLLELHDGAFADRRVLMGIDELRKALGLAGIIDGEAA